LDNLEKGTAKVNARLMSFAQITCSTEQRRNLVAWPYLCG